MPDLCGRCKARPRDPPFSVCAACQAEFEATSPIFHPQPTNRPYRLEWVLRMRLLPRFFGALPERDALAVLRVSHHGVQPDADAARRLAQGNGSLAPSEVGLDLYAAYRRREWGASVAWAGTSTEDPMLPYTTLGGYMVSSPHPLSPTVMARLRYGHYRPVLVSVRLPVVEGVRVVRSLTIDGAALVKSTTEYDYLVPPSPAEAAAPLDLDARVLGTDRVAELDEEDARSVP